MRDRSPAVEDWIDKARRADIVKALDAVAPHHVISKKTRWVGPCPGCGGTDRFSLNLGKNIFWCRVGQVGGDAIAMAQHVLGCDFLEAVERVTGDPPPDRDISDAERARRKAHAEKLAAERAAEQQRRAAEHNLYRDKERRRAYDIWSSAGPINGTRAEAYLRHRGIRHIPSVCNLRCAPRLGYWEHVGGRWQVIHEGPAMVAAIQGPDLKFIGCHITYLDAGLKTASGKAQVFHPETGEQLDAKKVRGSQKGGHIHLSGDHMARRLVTGEGIETVLSVWMAEAGRGVAPSLYWASVNLGNLGGKAAAAVDHPSETRTDSLGRVRRLKVPGPVPDLADAAVMMAPEHVDEVLLLGDGDSDRFSTENVLRRFAARNARPGRRIRAAWADAGGDFNDMWRGAA